MAQDLINKHWVAEISRVSAVYGDGHILSGEMDKDRDNGEIVAVGNYKEGEYYTVGAFAGDFEAKVIDIANNDRMKFQQGVFLMLDQFDLVNKMYLTKNVRSDVDIKKYILGKDLCPQLTALVEQESPWYSFSNLLDIGAGIQTAIDCRRSEL
jgi:hypothetical protein